MGIFDRAMHEVQNAAGRLKQGAGRTRADRPLENEGKRQRKAADLKKAADHVKDAFKKK
jgi:uncharacterized protein YjbJ (UPF0337 family)